MVQYAHPVTHRSPINLGHRGSFANPRAAAAGPLVPIGENLEGCLTGTVVATLLLLLWLLLFLLATGGDGVTVGGFSPSGGDCRRGRPDSK